MLYELALPALLVKTLAQRVLIRRGASLPAPALRLRADRGRLQRAELRMVSRVAPMLAARMALGRLERINPLHRHAIHAPQGANLLHTRAGLPFARRLGPVDGPRLLLLHGWNADSTMLLPLARALAAAGFAVELPDLASAGLTARRHLDLQHVARRIAAEATAFGPYEAVIGHSAGGLVAALAHRAGLRAHRLVTISSPASVASLLTGYLTFTDAPAVLTPALLRLYQSQRGRDPAAIGPEDYALFGAAHLVIHAGNDWQVSPQAAARICEGRAGLHPVILPGCNHHSVLRHGDLAGLIQRFVTAAPRETEASC